MQNKGFVPDYIATYNCEACKFLRLYIFYFSVLLSGGVAALNTFENPWPQSNDELQKTQL